MGKVRQYLRPAVGLIFIALAIGTMISLTLSFVNVDDDLIWFLLLSTL